MEANELRIGNYIQRLDIGDDSNRIEQIIELRKDSVFTSGPVMVVCQYDEISPIPLDEEWLLKFGFVNSDYDETKFNPADEYADQFKYILESGVFRRQLVCKPIEGWIVRLGDYESQVEIKHVHQLQNLYFTLTGKELTLK